VIFLSLVIIAFSVTYGLRRQVILFEVPGVTLERSFVLGTLGISCLVSLLFLINPAVFSALSLEDGPVEWGSAVLLFFSSAVCSLCYAKVRKLVSVSMVTKLTLVLLALVFFVIAMEEISWFQRILNLETPLLFKGNEQGEINFHNYATNRMENLYYFGAFLFLVVLPFLRVLYPSADKNKQLGPLIPRPFVAIIGSMACAYNFDMWNIIFIQIAFLGSLILMFLLALFIANEQERIVVFLALFLIVVTQAVFLVNGDNYSRLWDVTEYKEFFIPLGFLAYSVSVYRNVACSKSLSYERQSRAFCRIREYLTATTKL
jgi:hypothetical protein